VEQKPDRQILQVKDLFNDDYIEQTKRFDITSDSPESASVGINSDLKPWSDYLRQEVKRFKDELERIVDKYSMYLDPDTLDVAEQLIDSSFVGIIDYGPTLVAHVRSLGHHESFPLFVTPGSEDVVREYIDAFSDLVEIYNREASSDRKVRITEELWRNDELPKIGSARISHLLTGADPIPNDASPRTESEQQT